MESRLLNGGARLAVFASAQLAAEAAAGFIAQQLRAAIAQRGRCSLAVSGGETPRPMFEQLALEDLAWNRVDLFQVDERVAPGGDPARNASDLAVSLVSRVALERVHWIPVESPHAVTDYANALRQTLGEPAVLDLVHLGLGADGHTASLVPGDPALDVDDSDVAAVGEYRGHSRVTLSFPALNRARQLVWLVSGASKRQALAALVSGKPTAPAGRVERRRALIIADAAAAQPCWD